MSFLIEFQANVIPNRLTLTNVDWIGVYQAVQLLVENAISNLKTQKLSQAALKRFVLLLPDECGDSG